MALDKFRLINCLASGQHSQVWEVTDPTGGHLAMKLLLPEAFADPDQKASIKHEHKAGKSFDHPNIIKYHEVVVSKQHAYFTMELFRAPNLKAQIYSDRNSVQLRLKRLLELMALALEHVHDRGWLHKDVKPENILVNKASEVRLIDFSLSARMAGALGKMFGGKQAIQGTRTYMAPEQILGKQAVPQTDMYSLGITVFEMLTGEPPFKGSTPKNLLLRHINEPAPAPSIFNPNVTPEMDRLVLRLLAKKPENRYKKMAELLVELRNVTLFKEPIQETVVLTEEQLDQQAREADTIEQRLDSRRDARRSISQKAGGAPVQPAAAPPTPAAAPKSVAAPAPAPATAPAPNPVAAAPQPAASVRPAAPATPAPKPATAPPAARPPQQSAPVAPPQPPVPPAQRPAAPAAQSPPGQPAPVPSAARQPIPQPPAAQPGVRSAAASPPVPARPAAAAAPAAPGAKPPVPAAAHPAAPKPAAPKPAAASPTAGSPAATKPAATKPAAPAPPQRPPAPQPAKAPAQPAAARPPQTGARPAPAPAKGPAAKPQPAAPSEQGMNIEDMPFFDELPPIS